MGNRGYILFWTFLTSVVLVLLGSPFVEAKQVSMPLKRMYETDTEEPQHIPVGMPLERKLERQTEEPQHIPVSMVEDTDESVKIDLLEFEEASSNIEWPVKIPDEEERQQLERQAQVELDDRIVNGQQVQITDRPFQVYIGGCGGSLVSPNWVLTAGHCITNENGYWQTQWHVKAGSNDNSGSHTRTVNQDAIIIHPDWHGNINQEGIVDLALMYIQTPFPESNSIRTIEINDRHSNLQGSDVTASGWGKTEAEASPAILSETTMQVGSDINDANGMGVLRMPNTQGNGICQGDSGGPATYREDNGNDILVGVASYVFYPCGPGVNGGLGTHRQDSANYVDINKYVDWIRQSMNQDDDDSGSNGNNGNNGNNVCFNIGLMTSSWGSEISWSVGSCTSNQVYADAAVYTQECCLAAGDYTITCTDTYGDGWHGGYLEINGVQYCGDFTTGHQQLASLTITSGGSVPACSNINSTGYCIDVNQWACEHYGWFRDDCKQLCNAC